MSLKPFSVASCVIALLLLNCGTTLAQDLTVFGMRLGKALTMPECERNEYLNYVVGVGSKTCYKRDERVYGVPADKKYDKKFAKNYKKSNPPPALGTEQVEIEFSVSEMPQFIAGLRIFGTLINGKLEGIGFDTFGISNADLMLSRLKEKYGVPTSFLPLKVQNRLGATFRAFIATWEAPDLCVIFTSVGATLDRGSVTIDTKTGRAWRDQRLKESLSDKRPL